LQCFGKKDVDGRDDMFSPAMTEAEYFQLPTESLKMLAAFLRANAPGEGPE